MILRPPRSTLTDTLFPYTTLFRSYAAKIHREDIEMVGGGAERDRARRGMSSPGNSRRTCRGNDNPAEGFPLRSAAIQIFASISQAVDLATGSGAPDPGAAFSCLRLARHP